MVSKNIFNLKELAVLLQTCMLMATSKELWVGSADKNIYVIGIDQMKKTRVLHEHQDALVSITHFDG